MTKKEIGMQIITLSKRLDWDAYAKAKGTSGFYARQYDGRCAAAYDAAYHTTRIKKDELIECLESIKLDVEQYPLGA